MSQESLNESANQVEYEPLNKYYHVIEAIHRAPLTDLDLMYSEMEGGGVSYTDAIVQIDPYSSTTMSHPDVNRDFFLSSGRGIGVVLRGRYSVYERVLGDIYTDEIEPEMSSAEELIVDKLRSRVLPYSGTDVENKKVSILFRGFSRHSGNQFSRYRQAIIRLYQTIEERIDPNEIINFSEGSIEMLTRKIEALRMEQSALVGEEKEEKGYEIEKFERIIDGYRAAIVRSAERIGPEHSPPQESS